MPSGANVNIGEPMNIIEPYASIEELLAGEDEESDNEAPNEPPAVVWSRLHQRLTFLSSTKHVPKCVFSTYCGGEKNEPL